MATPTWLRDSLVLLQGQRRITEFYESLYSGNLEEKISNVELAEVLKNSNDYRTLNLARTAVDAPLERMKIAGIICADEKARIVLEDFWSDNELEFESHTAHEKSLEFGHAALIALPDPDDPTLVNAYIHSPGSVMVFYNPARPKDKSYAVHIYIQYGTGEEPTSMFNTTEDTPRYFVAEVYLPDTIQKWISSTPVASSVDMETMDLRLMEEVDEPIPGVVPVFHFRTARTPTGRSRLVDVAGPQLAINDTLTALMASVRRAGYRQRWLTHGRTVGGDAFTDSSTSEDIEQSEYVAGPDTILTFGGDSVQVGTFDVSDSSNFLGPINDLAGYLARISDIPTHYFTTGATAPSGESYRQGERPLAAVVEHCQALFNATWSELFDYVLALHGMQSDNSVSWAPAVYQDEDWYQSQLLKRELGVPDSVLLVESGYSNDQIEEWRDDAKDDITEDIALNADETSRPDLKAIIEAKAKDEILSNEESR